MTTFTNFNNLQTHGVCYSNIPFSFICISLFVALNCIDLVVGIWSDPVTRAECKSQKLHCGYSPGTPWCKELLPELTTNSNGYEVDSDDESVCFP